MGKQCRRVHVVTYADALLERLFIGTVSDSSRPASTMVSRIQLDVGFGVGIDLTQTLAGVPGVTQCPIAPSNTMTYRFKATQHGTTWYHSHFTLQYANGLLGPLIINGPATADYDEDLGSIFLSDWSHTDVFELWRNIAKKGAPPALDNGLINGTNVFDCSASTDKACLGNGKHMISIHVTEISALLTQVNRHTF